MTPSSAAIDPSAEHRPHPKVGFLCIGAQKGGTTWLNEQLLRHPGVYLPPVKEVHYFNFLVAQADRGWILDHYVRPARLYLQQALADPHNINWPLIAYYGDIVAKLESGQVDADWYRAVYGLCDEPNRLLGDITPAYLALPEAGIAEVKKYNASIKLIALLREPVDRALSAARMMLKRKKIHAPADDDWRRVLKGHGVVEKSRYANRLSRWLDVFARDQLLVLPYEMIAEDARSVIDQVCDFLALDRLDDADILTERVHVGRDYPVPDWVHAQLETQLAAERATTIAMLPDLASWWQRTEDR